MSDLLNASVVAVALAGLLALAGVVVGRRMRPAIAQLFAAIVVAFIVLFVWRWSQSPALARLVPFSGAIVLTDAVLPATALLAGVAWARLPGGRARRAVLIVPLVALCGVRTFRPLLGAPPANLDDRWKQGVCLQTSSSSRSAAAAATLLRAHGIDASEPEMAELCLTRPGGTPMLGLYRGLLIKTRGTPWRVEPVTGATAAHFATRSFPPEPVLLSVGLPRNTRGLDPRYEHMWGWVPGVRHTVVAFRLVEGGAKVEIGDPAIGRERWSSADLGVLWSGEGLRLVRR